MFLKLTSAHGGILLVNMQHIISIQIGNIGPTIDGMTRVSTTLTRASGGQFEVTESFEEIQRLLGIKQ